MPGEACKKNSPKRFLPSQIANLVNTSGYFKRPFSIDEKQEVQKLFSQYRHGMIPLNVQIKLLNYLCA
ncbi:DUF1722 domain-containing protein [Syntrophotalea carbinolica]|uniref:DUF1722 domain-containing protein n=1 Tax=Syntrophotalea carbinolica TaxID=19 RepID=UPI0002F821A6